MLIRTLFFTAALAVAPMSTIAFAQTPPVAPPVANADAKALSNLASLRRSVENTADLKKIIERFAQFIDANPGTPAAADAKKDLAVWQDRLAKKMTKVGGKWVSPEEREGLAKKGSVAALAAIDFVRQGKMRDADAALKDALDSDPNNITALYLRGVLSYRQDQLPPARKSFETLNTVIAGHAPTLNNLAVILSRQNAIGPALNYMAQALEAAPMNQLLLNNAAEMLHALPDAERKTPVATKLARTFADQDTQLAAALARQGQFRWGATWVDKATLERLQAAEKEVQAKVDALQVQISGLQARDTEIAGEISSKQESMSQIQQQSAVLDKDNKPVYLPLPPYYYQLQNDINRLQTERNGLGGKAQAIRDQIAKAQQAIPTPRYTGVVHIVDVEGTPTPPPEEIMNPTPLPIAASVPTTIHAPAPSITPQSSATTRAVAPTSTPSIEITISGAATAPTTAPATVPSDAGSTGNKTGPVVRPTNSK